MLHFRVFSYVCTEGWNLHLLNFHINMESKHIEIQYKSAKEEELSAEDFQLIEQAKKATHTSYSPFSHFSVGAAILLDNGEIIKGSNQENAAYTTGTCAERCAMFYANAQFPEVGIKTLAIAARGTNKSFTPSPISPCGACRQVLAEVEHRFHPFRVLLYGKDKIYIFESFADLLPFQFNESSL